MKPESILIYEPQCLGFEHTPFNAALINTFRLGYPDAELTFIAEQDHLNQTRDICDRYNDSFTGTTNWKSINIPERELMGWRRLIAEFRALQTIFKILNTLNADLLVLSSITPTAFILIKIFMYMRLSGPGVIIFFHSALASITQIGRRPWNWPISLRFGLMYPHPKHLKLMALGESICSEVNKIMPRINKFMNSFNHPYLWHREVPGEGEIKSQRKVRFGFFGVSAKGFEQFVRLAKDIKQIYKNAEFWLVGYVNESMEHVDEIKGVGYKPLTQEEYTRRAEIMHYNLWCGVPERYRLRASGSFMDSLAFGKPCIALENEFISHHFKRAGNIGYLCENYNALLRIVKEILNDFPAKIYSAQVRNLMLYRKSFEPDHLKNRLRKIVQSI